MRRITWVVLVALAAMGCIKDAWPDDFDAAADSLVALPNVTVNVSGGGGGGYGTFARDSSAACTSLFCLTRDFRLANMTRCPPPFTVDVKLELPKDESRLSRALRVFPLSLVVEGMEVYLAANEPIDGYKERIRATFSANGQSLPLQLRQWPPGTSFTNVSQEFPLPDLNANDGGTSPENAQRRQAFKRSGEATLSFEVSAECSSGFAEPEYTAIASRLRNKPLFRLQRISAKIRNIRDVPFPAREAADGGP